MTNITSVRRIIRHFARVSGKSLGIAALAAVTLPLTLSSAAEPQLGKKLIDNLRAARPDIPILSVTESPLPNLYTIELEGGGVLYGTADGTHIISGDMYRIENNDLTNLAEVRREVRRRDLMAEVPAADAWVFAAAGGKPKAVINVFTDVDCHYCRQLHLEVPQLNAMGIEVRYLGYPRAGIGSESYSKIVSAWCSSDRDEALTAAKAGTAIPAKDCDNPIADQYNLGQRVGVTGTPAIITQDGRLIPGYRPAAILAADLGVASGT